MFATSPVAAFEATSKWDQEEESERAFGGGTSLRYTVGFDGDTNLLGTLHCSLDGWLA